MRAPLRWTLFFVAAAVLFAFALSSEVYNVTSPRDYSAHVWLRKFYSIVAFALLGGLYAFARRRVHGADAALTIALYSGAIEIAQWFTGDEPLEWNLIDVACGALGGALGAGAFSRWVADRVK